MGATRWGPNAPHRLRRCSPAASGACAVASAASTVASAAGTGAAGGAGWPPFTPHGSFGAAARRLRCYCSEAQRQFGGCGGAAAGQPPPSRTHPMNINNARRCVHFCCRRAGRPPGVRDRVGWGEGGEGIPGTAQKSFCYFRNSQELPHHSHPTLPRAPSAARGLKIVAVVMGATLRGVLEAVARWRCVEITGRRVASVLIRRARCIFNPIMLAAAIRQSAVIWYDLARKGFY